MRRGDKFVRGKVDEILTDNTRVVRVLDRLGGGGRGE